MARPDFLIESRSNFITAYLRISKGVLRKTVFKQVQYLGQDPKLFYRS